MDNKPKMISKGDICLIIVILLVAAAALLWRRFTADDGAKAIVTIDGEVIEELSLAKDKEVKVLSPEGYNLVVVKDGQVTVSDADCRDHICVRHQPVSKQGETIICLPHKLVVEVFE